MVQFDLIVRNFRQEDLPYLIGLYDNTLAESSHFIRDENFLRYFMNYIGVHDEGVFVAEANDEIKGFAIVSVTEEGGLRLGSIVELQVKDASSMRVLIQVAQDYCKNKDVDVIFVVPPPLLVANGVLKDWLKFETGMMMTKVLSVSLLLQALFSSEEIRNSYAKERIVFRVGKEIVEVKIAPKLVEVRHIDSKPKETEMLVTMSPRIMLKIIFGQINPYLAYLTGRVRVRNLRNTIRILKLLAMMKFAVPLHVGLSDRM